MATQRRPPGERLGQIPDLDVRVPAAPKRRGRTEPPASRPGSGLPPLSSNPESVQEYFGSGTFDAEHFGGDQPDLQLETGDAAASEHGDAAPPVGASFRPAAAPRAGRSAGIVPSRARADAPKTAEPTWPTGRSPDSSSIQVDPVEVRLTADYGPAPTNPLAAPLYAYRVWDRHRTLRARVASLASRLSSAEHDRDRLLASVMEGLRDAVLAAEGGNALLTPVLDVERRFGERRSALAGANAERERRAAEIDAGADAVRRDRDVKRADVDRAAEAFARSKEALDRAAAKKKRLYIEIRGILDVAEKAGGPLSAAQAARIAELEAGVASQKPDLERAEDAAEVAERVRATAEAELRLLDRRLAEAERMRRALDVDFEKQVDVRSEGLAESERERTSALADAMRSLLAARGRPVEIPRDSLDRIARADEAVTGAATELEKCVRAMDAHESEAFRRGLVVSAALVLLLAGLLVAKFVF